MLQELEEIEVTVNKLENAAYRLDSHTLKLEEKINDHIKKLKGAT
jgi:predicted  nucleic acid-binding Zn-ribbon protein